jgi:hypothetical protein
MKAYIVSEEVILQLLDCMDDSEASGRHEEGSEIIYKILASPPAEPVAWCYEGSAIEMPSVAQPYELDEQQKQNCVPLYRKDA